ncbi:hypothetical protein POF50_032290 [Streptomyces sp. SL13]|uniref:Uncharacterized protein n=1 Tax=Streptantibioticus silvisoli TaxID=2705255 RepID=A0AA90H8Q0_9ACTN|nr:hypothetical protein [Streptantibioticus silvisoli]MDI5973971.1 hypothetical protein [Streptantibioticus silvisoli]
MDELLQKVASSITVEDVEKARRSSAAMRETSEGSQNYNLQMFAVDQH